MDSLTYRQHGDYLIPDLTLQARPEDDKPLGKYGLMRRNYLKAHRTILYNSLLLKEQLYPHLREIDEAAQRRLTQLMDELAHRDPPPDKATDQTAWMRHRNSLRHQAEELILTELIYS